MMVLTGLKPFLLGGECPDLYEGRNAADEEDEEPPAE